MKKRKPEFKAYEGEWTSARQKIYEEIMFHAEPIEEGSKHRGHDIEVYRDEIVFSDTKLPVRTNPGRICGHCNLENTKEGYDGCIGFLSDERVKNACCGHGTIDEAYIQYWEGLCLRGQEALDKMKWSKGK
jgi:hypothetical protein